MKKILTIILIAAFAISTVSAQRIKTHKRYKNLSYVQQETKLMGVSEKSEFGAALTMGTTYFLHKKPILGLINIGIDFSYFDLNYANYKFDHDTEGEITRYQGEFSMHLGPSVTLNLLKNTDLKAYARYAPTGSAMWLDGQERIVGGYVGYTIIGATFSWRALSFGAESRIGKGRYKDLGTAYEAEFGGGINQDFNNMKQDVDITSTRFFIGFRF